MFLINSKDKRKPFALVGGMGAGKSTAIEIFATEGFEILNSDKVLHAIYSASHPKFETLAKLLDMFLHTTFLKEHNISRQIIRERVGHDTKKLQRMIYITRPFVLVEIKERCKHLEMPLVEFPLLFEMDLRQHFSDVVCITCSEDTQIKRIKARNPTITDNEIKSMLEVQKSNSFKEQHSDYIINNEQADEKNGFLTQQIKTVAHELKKSYAQQ